MGCCASKCKSAWNAAWLPEETDQNPGGEDKRKLLDLYVVSDMLGQGTFGVVYACKKRGEESGTDYAVKMVDKVETPVEKIKLEADFLLKMDHPNIIQCFDVIYDKCFVCIVMERLRGGDLISGMQKHWKAKGKIPIAITVNITTQMSSSVEYLHRQCLVHRDVKGDNFLCDQSEIEEEHNRIVLTDFGTVATCRPTQRLTEKCGTKLYWSPEFYARNYSHKVDIWALGVVCYGLLNGRFPFRDENEVKTKVVKFRADLSSDGVDFMNGLLCKKEEDRLTSSAAIQHSWISSETEGIDTVQDGPDALHVSTNPDLLSHRKRSMDSDLIGIETLIEAPFHRESRANPGVEQRRLELIDRIQDVQQRMSSGCRSSELTPLTQEPYWKDIFYVPIRHPNSKVCKYEWWPLDRAQKEIEGWTMMSQESDPMRKSNGSSGESGHSVEVIGKMLEEHGIAVEKFGVGEAKTLEKLAAEVQSGAGVLMVDASQHKKLVRVVHVVLLRITSSTSKPKILVETGERFADGRSRKTDRLPGAKKEPHENSRQTAERILQEYLNFPEGKVKVDLAGKEVFQEEDESPSYPGVQTVYHKEILTAHVAESLKPAFSTVSFTSTTNSEKEAKEAGSKHQYSEKETMNTGATTLFHTGSSPMRKKLSLVPWHYKDKKNNTKFFAWWTEKECEKKKVKFRAPEAVNEVSCFVHAPLGMEEEELKKFLESYNVDVSKFDGRDHAKTLKELCAQLARGECQLVPDSQGCLKRIVDVVLVKLVCKRGVVIETEQAHTDGRVKAHQRLPGAKRRPDENQFMTAKRILEKQLKVDESRVRFEEHEVLVHDNREDNAKFPGLPTTYKKRILTALLLENT